LPGNRKRGRPKTVWIDSVITWTGLKLEDTIRKVDNRSAWRTTIRSVAYPWTEDRLKTLILIDTKRLSDYRANGLMDEG